MFEPWVSKSLFCLGLFLLAYALMHASAYWLRRLGLWLVFATLGLVIWLISENWILTVIGLLVWFAVPLVQAIHLSRSLRFSLSRSLVKNRLELDEYEDWTSLSQDLREGGFSLDGEYELKPSPIEYGFRLFRQEEKNWVAGLGLVRQSGVSLSYLLIMTKARDGTLWLTWDYPLAYGLKMPPHVQVFRCLEAESVQELLAQHEEYLALNEVEVIEEKLEPQEVFDAMFGDTMRYNLTIGLLRSSNHSEEEILYSWRGTFFITWQVLRYMVRG
jgi:hypothetical protein